jgi:hypothetical protein
LASGVEGPSERKTFTLAVDLRKLERAQQLRRGERSPDFQISQEAKSSSRGIAKAGPDLPCQLEFQNVPAG